jgi:hypothetical protein
MKALKDEKAVEANIKPLRATQVREVVNDPSSRDMRRERKKQREKAEGVGGWEPMELNYLVCLL